MRTKTLLLTAALSAAGVATSMAQVYSVNAVGYVNTTLEPGLNLISNPLDAADNSSAGLFAGVPDNTQVYKFDPSTGQYSTASYSALLGAWTGESAVTVEPGEGVFVRNPTAAAVTVTFVGEVPQGALGHPVPAGLSIQASEVPQTGTATELEFPVADNDQIYKFDPATSQYDTFTYSALLSIWTPSEPTINVGEAVFVRKTAAADWERNFDINATE